MKRLMSLHAQYGHSFAPGVKTVFWPIALGIAFALAAALPVSAQIGDTLKRAKDQVENSAKDVSKAAKDATKPSTDAPADANPNTLAQNADKQLSEAQKLMFGGKKDEAVETLLKAAKDIEQLRKAAPEHAKLKALHSKAERLKQDLERRTNKMIDLKSGTAKDKEAPAAPDKREAKPKPDSGTKPDTTNTGAGEAPKTGSTGRLPAPAQQAMRDLENKFRSIEDCYRWVDTYRERKEDPAKMEEKLKRAKEIIGELQLALNTAKQEASQRGVTSHPDFDAAQKRIDEQPARLEKALAEVKQQAAGAATSKAEVQKDVEDLRAGFDSLREKIFNKATGVAIYFNDMKPVEELIALIEGFEKQEQAAVKKTLTKFAAKYGETRDAIDKKAEAMGYAGNRRASYVYEEMKKGVENVAKTRSAMAEDLAKRAEDQLGRLTKGHDFFRIQQHNAVREYLTMAKRFDAAIPKVKELSESVEKRLAEDMKALGAKIDGVKWPGSVSGKKKEEEAGLKYFKESPDWEKRPTEPRHVLGVAIRGEWTVQKKNLLGQPTQHGIPALLAVQVDGEKKDNLARVYNLTLRNAESANAKPEPPFTEITVGDSWYIRPSAVK
jgi:flagellin-specific chaperone FliS